MPSPPTQFHVNLFFFFQTKFETHNNPKNKKKEKIKEKKRKGRKFEDFPTPPHFQQLPNLFYYDGLRGLFIFTAAAYLLLLAGRRTRSPSDPNLFIPGKEPAVNPLKQDRDTALGLLFCPPAA